MKKIKNIILLLIVVALSLSLFVSCGNHQIFDTNYTYTRAYLKVGGDEWIDVSVAKWCDYEGEQIQLILTDGSVLLVSSYNCILYNGRLPKKE